MVTYLPTLLCSKKDPTSKEADESETIQPVYRPLNVEIATDSPFFVVWQDNISHENVDIF